MSYQLTLTPPQLDEIIRALHNNRNEIASRLRRQERLKGSELEQRKQEQDPTRKQYLDTIKNSRETRIKVIDIILSKLTEIEITIKVEE